MKSVGVRELKARLSRHLEDVRHGEVILVTDRGKVVAELRASGATADPVRDEFEQRIEDWVRDGRARVGPPNDPVWYASSPLRCSAGTAERLLDELRADAPHGLEPRTGTGS